MSEAGHQLDGEKLWSDTGQGSCESNRCERVKKFGHLPNRGPKKLLKLLPLDFISDMHIYI